MKYIYMVCLALSSLFTYKQPSAESNMVQYAFFIPKDAFQRNVDMPATTRYVRENNKNVNTNINPHAVGGEVVIIKSPQNTGKPEAVLMAKNKKVPATRNKAFPSKKAKEKSPDYASNIQVEKNTSPVSKAAVNKIVQPKATPISANDLQNKDLAKLLTLLPYPDFDLPKFKQLYAIYALDLRTFYRKGELLANPEQEDVLAKANTMRRFEVK